MTKPDDINLGDCQDFFLEVCELLNLSYTRDIRTNELSHMYVRKEGNGLDLMRALYSLRSALDLPCDIHTNDDEHCPFCLNLCAPCEQ